MLPLGSTSIVVAVRRRWRVGTFTGAECGGGVVARATNNRGVSVPVYCRPVIVVRAVFVPGANRPRTILTKNIGAYAPANYTTAAAGLRYRGNQCNRARTGYDDFRSPAAHTVIVGRTGFFFVVLARGTLCVH